MRSFPQYPYSSPAGRTEGRADCENRYHRLKTGFARNTRRAVGIRLPTPARASASVLALVGPGFGPWPGSGLGTESGCDLGLCSAVSSLGGTGAVRRGGLAAVVIHRALRPDDVSPTVLTYAWERLRVDPLPGPRDPDGFVGPGAGGPVHLADDLLLIDPAGEARGMHRPPDSLPAAASGETARGLCGEVVRSGSWMRSVTGVSPTDGRVVRVGLP
ncbi:DUF1152 domain-containing protein [Frankia gtarii]|uniref:DUF1152 domain-containing protein n=1 Tax=Frankia gtarii TaxID=2950102 RepID=UPI0034D5D76D